MSGDVEVRIENLQRAAAFLRDASPVLDDLRGVVSTTVPPVAGLARGHRVSTAVLDFARTWDTALDATGRGLAMSAHLLQSAADVYLAVDRAGARGLLGPPPLLPSSPR